MEPQNLRVFLEKAEGRLAGIRGGLLLAAQNGFSARDIEIAANRVKALHQEADSCGLGSVSETVAHFAAELSGIARSGSVTRNDANRSLDIIARVEAALLEMSLGSDDFLTDVDGLVESSFGQLQGVETGQDETTDDEEENFEVDEETLEIFRSEADGLLANISANLTILGASPDDTNALWEVRRNAHTFKGSAGIVGFKSASSLAHRVEDLLDKMVESRCSADARVIELLGNATDQLGKLSAGTCVDDPMVAKGLSLDFEAVLTSLSATGNGFSNHASPQTRKHGESGKDRVEPTQTSMPIVRVSLDRLDDLLKVTRGLVANRSAVAEQLTDLADGSESSASRATLGALLETQRRLADEILRKLLDIRMVRFGTLETRLNRAVLVTCQEESKKAAVSIRGGDVEIDTQTLDALIEPLLHLLKNAVVHGIESPETRRLLGKTEKGQIEIDVRTSDEELFVTVSDDGKGIYTEKLIEKAIANNVITAEAGSRMTEQEAFELIFHRGLTTAESLSMNAGRGVGMSIVRQSVEAYGGSLTVESEPQKGACFTIMIPVVQAADDDDADLPPDHEPQPAGVPLVLIVDDSPSIRRQMAMFVEDVGFRVITAVDGADALELLLNGKHEPDLILSDVEMPNMDGWEFLEYVKTDDNFGHVPVVMVTSLDAVEYREKAAKLGASAYIVKPFGISDLERVLTQFCAAAVA